MPSSPIYTLSLHDALPICQGLRIALEHCHCFLTRSRRRRHGRRADRCRLRAGASPVSPPQHHHHSPTLPDTEAISFAGSNPTRSEEHTSELQSPDHLVCRLPPSTLFPYTTLFRSARVFALPWNIAIASSQDHADGVTADGLIVVAFVPARRRCRHRSTITTVPPYPTPRQSASPDRTPRDRKSTRLNSSHQIISYAVFPHLHSFPTRRSSDLPGSSHCLGTLPLLPHKITPTASRPTG